VSSPPFRITRLSSQARKFLAKRDRKSQHQIAAALDFVSSVSPFHHPNPTAIKRLHGKFEGLHRFRVGRIRIIYSVDQSVQSIDIISIDDRGDAYK
jgi:mRNA interferase RelE/StbE